MTKRKRGAVLVPWLSARPDNKEGRFLQVGNSLLLSKQFQALTGASQKTYLCMAMESGGKREFQFPHAVAHKKYGISGTTLDRALKELLSGGFIIIKQHGGLNFPSIYNFSSEWKTNSLPRNGEREHIA